MLDIWTLKWRAIPPSINGYTDLPLGQGDKMQIRNGSQDEKQQNKIDTLILSKLSYKCEKKQLSFHNFRGKKGILYLKDFGRWQLLLRTICWKAESEQGALRSLNVSALIKSKFPSHSVSFVQLDTTIYLNRRAFLCLNENKATCIFKQKCYEVEFESSWLFFFQTDDCT